MINILNCKTLSLNTWFRYVAYVHLIEITKGWKKKCKVIVPLNYIDPRFELLETVHFENYVSHADAETATSLTSYIEDFLSVLYPAECPFEENSLYLFEDFGIPVLPSKHPRTNPQLLFWRDYFPHYEVKGFKKHGWVTESPYRDEINFPSIYNLTYKGEKKGVSRYQIKDKFQLEK